MNGICRWKFRLGDDVVHCCSYAGNNNIKPFEFFLFVFDLKKSLLFSKDTSVVSLGGLLIGCIEKCLCQLNFQSVNFKIELLIILMILFLVLNEG